MTPQRMFEEATRAGTGRARRPGGAVLSIAGVLLFGCGGSGHGTMMAQQSDGGGGTGGPGGGAGGARVDAGVDGMVSPDAKGDGAASDAPIRINVTVDRCPTVLAAASPSSSWMDKPVAVDATADDSDGDPLTYVWSAPVGTFARATAASTTYTCAGVGDVMLTVTVSDSKCEGRAAVPLTCLATP